MLSYVEHNKKILTEEGKDWQKVASRLKELESLYSEGSVTENLLNDEHTLDAIAALVNSVNQSNISAYIQDYMLIINKIILQHSQALNACFRHLAWVMTKYKRSFPKRTFAPLLESVFKTYEPYFQQENCKKWELLAIEKDVAEASLMQLAVIYESWGYNCFFGQAYRPWYIKV